jgi:prepilin-type N-terminal cleavage/methylation domain-containing protein
MRKRQANEERGGMMHDTVIRPSSSVRRGLTLTEVVVASAILGVAIVPILKALTIAQVTSRVVERRTQSVILAQEKLDEIRARCLLDYDDAFGEGSAALGDSYLCDVTDDQDETLRQITVSVGFDADSDGNLSGDEVQATLTTYVAKVGV